MAAAALGILSAASYDNGDYEMATRFVKQ